MQIEQSFNEPTEDDSKAEADMPSWGNWHVVSTRQKRIESFWTPQKPDIGALFPESETVYYPVTVSQKGDAGILLYPNRDSNFFSKRDKSKAGLDGGSRKIRSGSELYVAKGALKLIDNDLVDRLISEVSFYDIYRFKRGGGKNGADCERKLLRVYVLSRDIKLCQRKDLPFLFHPKRRHMFEVIEEKFTSQAKRYCDKNPNKVVQELGSILSDTIFASMAGNASAPAIVRNFILLPIESAIVYERTRGLIACATPTALKIFPKLEGLITKDLR